MESNAGIAQRLDTQRNFVRNSSSSNSPEETEAEEVAEDEVVSKDEEVATKETGEVDSEEIVVEIGVAEEEVVAEDILPRHTLASPDIINKDSNRDIRESSRFNRGMDMLRNNSILNNSNNSNPINNMRLLKCRETSNREGSGQPCPGMEEGFQLDDDDDVLRNDFKRRKEANN